MDDKLLRIPEVSALIGVPVATLRFWRHNGTGPRSVKLGGRVVFKESEVLAWVEASFSDDIASTA